MKMIPLSRLLGLVLALFASAAMAQTVPTITSWSKANASNNTAFSWLDATNWSNGFANNAGSIGWMNTDINPYLSIADHIQSITGTGSTVAQVILLTGGPPTNNSLSVTDGSFYWSQTKGSNNAGFIVTYVPGATSVSVAYAASVAPGAGRTLTIAYSEFAPGNVYEIVGITDDVRATFTRTLTASPVQDTTFIVSDGTYSWDPVNKSTVLDQDLNITPVPQSVFGVTYNTISRLLTVQYNNGNDPSNSVTPSGATFTSRQLSASYKTATAAGRGITLGTLGMGDQSQSGSEFMNLRLNSLTFDNNGAMANVIKNIGNSTDEIASGIHLANPLALAVRTGGDVNSSFRLGGNIDGTGALVKLDTGSVSITGNNTFSGPMIIRDTGGNTYLRSGMTLLNCTTTLGSGTVTCASTSGLAVGMAVSGPNIAPNAVVTAVATDGITFTISPAAVGSATLQLLTAKSTGGVLVKNCVTTLNSRVVTLASTSTTTGLAVGMTLSGTGVTTDAMVSAITSSTSFVMTTAATATSSATGVTLIATSGNFKLPQVTLTSCGVTMGSNLISCSDTSSLAVGMVVTDPGLGATFPPNAVVVAITSSTTFQISQPVTSALTGSTLTASANGDSLVTQGTTLPTITIAPVPLTTILVNCNVSTGSKTLNCYSGSTTAGLLPNMSISGPGIPANTIISSITNTTQFVINNLPTAQGFNKSLTIGSATNNPALTSGNVTCASTAGLVTGMSVSGTNIPANALITAISADTIHFTVSPAPTVAGSGLSLFVGNATTNLSSSVTCVSNTGLQNGMTITATGTGGPYLATGTTITGVIAATGTTPAKLTLSTAAIATGSNLTLQVGTIVTSGSSTVTCASTTGVTPGMIVRGTGIPADTVITSVSPSTFSFTMSNAATANGTSATVVVPPGLGLVGNTTTAGSTTVTVGSVPGLASQANLSASLVPGTLITGQNIPANTFVVSVAADGKSIVISAPATASGAVSLLTAMAAPGVELTGAKTTSGGTTITCDSTTGLAVGSLVTGANMPDNAIVTAITSSTQFVISSGATATSSAGVTLLATAGGYAVGTAPIAVTGVTVTLASPNITHDGSATLVAGMEISGTNIPAGAVIKSVTSSTAFTISGPAGASASGLTLTATNSQGLAVPAPFVTLTGCATTSGSNAIACASTAGLVLGTTVTGSTDIPAGATVSQVVDGKNFKISANAVGTHSGLVLTATLPSPVITLTNCSTTNGSTTLTCNDTTGLLVGALISGTTTPYGATIAQVLSPTTLRMSTSATSSSSAQTVVVTEGAMTTAQSPIVTTFSTANLTPGMTVTGAYIPTRSVITSITDATHFVLSAAATATATGNTLSQRANDARVIGRALLGCSTTSGSNSITCASTAGLTVGQVVTGTSTYIPANAVVTAITNGLTFTINAAALGTTTGLTLLASEPKGLVLPPLSLTNCTTTNGTANVTCASTTGLLVGAQLAAGPTIAAGTVVTQVVNATSFKISPSATGGGSGQTLAVSTTTSGSTTVTCGNTTGLAPGMLVTGNNMPTNAVVTSVTDTNNFVISSPATATGFGVNLMAVSTSALPVLGCATSSGSTAVTCASTTGLSVGQPVSGNGIPSGATIAGFNSSTSFTLSSAAMSTGSSLTLLATTTPPSADVVLTNASTLNNNQAVLCDSTVGLVAGMAVVGPNIPSGTTVLSIPSSKLFVMSQPASASGWGLTLGAGTNAISSSLVLFGSANRDGNTSILLQLQAPNQINSQAVIVFDGASGRNPYLRTQGYNQTLAGIIDSTSNGVIENTEGEVGVFANSQLTLNTSLNYDYNGYFRNTSTGNPLTGGSTGTIGLTKLGVGTLGLAGGNVSYSGDTTIRGGGLKLTNTSNFASNISASRASNVELSTTSDWQFNQQIFGAGSLTKTGLNQVTLASDSGFTGATIINAGTLRLAAGTINEGIATANGSATVFTRTLTRYPAPGTLYVQETDSAGKVYQAWHDGQATPAGWTVSYNMATRFLVLAYNTAPASGHAINVFYRPADIQRVGNTNGSDKVFTTSLIGPPKAGTLFVTDGTNVWQSTTSSADQPVTGQPGTLGGGTVKYSQSTPPATAASPTVTVTYGSPPGVGLALMAIWAADEGLKNTTSITINGGTLLIDNQSINLASGPAGITRPELNSTDRINDAATIQSNGGNFSMRNGGAPDNYSESVGVLSLLSGFTTITTNPADKTSGKKSTLQFASLSRLAGSGATVIFAGPQLGATDGSDTQRFVTAPTLTNNNTGIIGGFAVAQDGGNFDFATYNKTGTVSIVPLAQNKTAREGPIASWTALTEAVTRGSQTSTKDIVVDSLGIYSTSAATVALGTHLLTVNSGGIIFAGTTGTTAHVISGNLTAGAASGYELDLWSTAAAQTSTVSASILNNPAVDKNTPANQGLIVVKSGPGEVKLTGSNSYTGGTRINGGDIEITSIGNLGNLPLTGVTKSDFLVLNGGALQATAASGQTTSTIIFGPTYGVTLGVGDGQFVLDPAVTMNIQSPIVGPGGLGVGNTTTGNQVGGGNLVISGANTFQGVLQAVHGTLTIAGGSNTFSKGMLVVSSDATIDVQVGSALPFNPTLTMNGGVFSLGSNARIGALTGVDGTTISAEADKPGATTVSTTLLTIDQATNTTFAGKITDVSNTYGLLGIEKKGAGVLTLTQSQDFTFRSDYQGITKISEGVLATSFFGVRGRASGIGQGSGGLARNQPGAPLLYIENGAALSYVGTTSSFSNRAFTIGVGGLGAAIYANGVGNSAIVDWEQGELFQSNVANDVFYAGQDNIAFSRPNEAATLTLGGTNVGDNLFAMDLHDNGVKSLSLQKSGAGNWVLGASLGAKVVLTNCQVGKAGTGGAADNLVLVTCASTIGLSPGMSVLGDASIAPGTTILQVINGTSFQLNRSALYVTPSTVTLTATGDNMILTGCQVGTAATAVADANLYLVTCASTAGLVPGMRIMGDATLAPGTTVGQILDGTSFTLSQPALYVSPSVVNLTVMGDALSDFTGNTAIYLGTLAVQQNGVLGAATGTSVVLTSCVTTQGGARVTCASTAGLVPGMTLKGLGLALGATVASVDPDGIHFTMNVPATLAVTLTKCSTTTNSNSSTVVTCASTENLGPGMKLSAGPGVPSNATVVSVQDATHFIMSAPATANTGTVSLTNCNTTAGQPGVTCDSTAGLLQGMLVNGPGLDPTSKVVAVTSGTAFTISPSAAATNAPATTPFTATVNITATIPQPVSINITATGGGVVQLIGGNLDLRNVTYTSSKTLALDGGRLRGLVGNSLWAGPVIADVSSTVEVGPGASLDLAGNISGRSGLTKVGFGTLTLEGANTFIGGMNINEGTLQLNYTRSGNSKLPDAATLTLGGGRKGATLDIVGNATGNSEKVNALVLGLGQNSITRSDPNSNTRVAVNAITVNQGATLDVQYFPTATIPSTATTTLANVTINGGSTGILGAWATVNLADWAANVNNSIVPYTGYTTNNWSGQTTNVNITASTTQTGVTQPSGGGAAAYTLRYDAVNNTPTPTTTTLIGDVVIRGGGILQAPTAGAVNNIITGGRLIPGNNFQGGNLAILQNDVAGSLQISSVIANTDDILLHNAISYSGNVNNRITITPGLTTNDYYLNMPVYGRATAKGPSNIRPGSFINAINPGGAGTINISQNLASVLSFSQSPSTISANANLRVGGVPGVNNQIHITDTTLPYPLPVVGQAVVGVGVPPGTVISSIVSTTPAGTDYMLSNDLPAINGVNLTFSTPQTYTANLQVGSVTNQIHITDATLPNPPLTVGQLVTGPDILPGTIIIGIVSTTPAGTDFLLSNDVPVVTGESVTFSPRPPPQSTFVASVGAGGVTNQININDANNPFPALFAGELVTGPNIPEGTVITSVFLSSSPGLTESILVSNNLIATTQYATANLQVGGVTNQIHITDATLPNPPLAPGQFVTGPGIPAGTVIASIVYTSPSGTDFLLNNAVPAASGVKLGFSLPQSQTANLVVSGVTNQIHITDPVLPNPPLTVGQVVNGPDIPPGTVITAIVATAPAGTDVLLSNNVPTVLGEHLTISPALPPTVTFTADTVVGDTPGVYNQIHITDAALPYPPLAVGQSVTGAGIPLGTTISSQVSATDYRLSNGVAQGTGVVCSTGVNVSFNVWGELTVGNAFVTTTVNNAPAYQVHLPVGSTSSLGLAVGQGVSGLGIPAGATIASILGSNDFTFRFPNSRVIQINSSSSSVTTYVVDLAVATSGPTVGVGNGTQVRLNGLGTNSTNNFRAGDQVTGPDIQDGTFVSGTAGNPVGGNGTDFTLTRNIFAPVIDMTIQSRNGVLKSGNGVAQLAGNNTFTGPVTITGGTLSVPQVTNGGLSGTLGASTSAASNVTIGGGTLQYTGNSTSVNRGFTINEVGAIDISSPGTTLNFTGNLSGGVGAALGTLQKVGLGTLQLSRTVTLGGAQNFGGFDVQGGTLQFKYNNPNDSNPNDRFAATTAALTLSGGKLELLGTPDNVPVSGSNFSEDRIQNLNGQLTVNAGASQVWATGAAGSAITLNLQNASAPMDVIRQAGGTVLFVENPNGGTSANITLAVNQIDTGVVLPWATYWDTSVLSQPGVNNFAAIEPSDNGLVSADSSRLYATTSDVSSWGSGQTVTESGTPFSGTVSAGTKVYAIRFFAKANGVVNISNALLRSDGSTVQDNVIVQGGAILATTNSGNFAKVIQGGQITSGLQVVGAATNDFIIHNYNPAHPLEIKSEIIDNQFVSPHRAVNLVLTGTGTTELYGNNLSTSANYQKNTYSGTTFLNGGVLRLATPSALPGGIGTTAVTGSNLTIDGGVLGFSNDASGSANVFTRGLGTGVNNVQWTGNGGFAAYGSTDVTVNIGGNATPSTLVWGASGFVPDSSELMLSSTDATASVKILNPINLGGVGRTVYVADGLGAIDAELAGGMSGNGGSLKKTGQGTLRLSGGQGTQTGGAVLAQGKLSVSGKTATSVNPGSLGSGPLGIGTTDDTNATDALTLELRGGSFSSVVTVGNKNSTGITTINATSSPTLTGPMTLGRHVFFGPQSGRKITIGGGLFDVVDVSNNRTGSGGFTVVDGGVLVLNGPSNLGVNDAPGQAVDGSVVLRSGSLELGNGAALGSATVELGDKPAARQFVVDRSSAGRSILLQGGVFDGRTAGLPGTTGSGGFLFNGQSSVTIDGKTYVESDSLLDGINDPLDTHHHRTLIMVNGETDSPDRNGLYELVYALGNAINVDSCTTAILTSSVGGATYAHNGTTVTLDGGIHNTQGLVVGMVVTGPGIPTSPPTTIVSISDNTTFSISQGSASDQLTAVTLTFTIGSTNINCQDTSSLSIGMPVFGPNIPASAVVNAVIDSTNFTINLPVLGATTTPVELTARTGDSIGLNRIDEFNDPAEMVYGTRVYVTNGSDAGKTFFLAANVTVALNNAFVPALQVYSPTLWKLDVLNPNVSLLVDAPDPTKVISTTLSNAIDINAGNGTGTMSLGGSSLLNTGTWEFSGNVVLQNGALTLSGCGTTTNSTVVTTASTAGLSAGMVLSGAGYIATGATVVSVTNGQSFVISAPAIGAGANLTFTAANAPVTRNLRLLSDTLSGRGVVFSGAFSEAKPTGDLLSLQKLGTGVVTLQSANTYQGGTTISSGTLLVNNSNLSASGTGTGPVTVSNVGSTLGGTGSIAGKTTFGSGSILSPGDPSASLGIGNLTFNGDLTLGAGSSAVFQLHGSEYDSVSVGGHLSVDPTAVLHVLLTHYVPDDSITSDIIYDILPMGPGTLQGFQNLADLLDLPGLLSSQLYWDTSSFNTTGEIKIAKHTAGDAPVARFAVSAARVRETPGGVSVTVSIQLDSIPSQTINLPLSVTGTATEGAQFDYDLNAVSPATLTPSHVLSIPAGQQSADLTILVHDDPIAEPSETVILSFVGQPGVVTKGSPGTFTLTIDDNDSATPSGSLWTLRNPLPTNERLQGIASSGSTLVTVGSFGKILTSQDNGATWNSTILGLNTNLNAVAVRPAAGGAPAKFVAVGDNGLVLTWANGDTAWGYHSTSGNNNLQGVTWADPQGNGTGVFVAVGQSGVVFTSTDGATWTYRPVTGLTDDLSAVTYGNLGFVAVGLNGALATSDDGGATWTQRVFGVASGNLRGVAFKANQFTAVGDGGVVMVSADTSAFSFNNLTWSAVTVTGLPNFRSIHVEGSNFLAAGLGGAIYRSSAGTVWASDTTSSGFLPDLQAGMALTSTQSLIVGASGYIVKEQAAKVWVNTGASSGPVSEFDAVAFDGQRFAAVGKLGMGAEYVAVDNVPTFGNPISAGTTNYAAVTSGAIGQFVAVGDAGPSGVVGAIIISHINPVTNKLAWVTTGVNGLSVNWRGVTFANGAYYAVGDGGTVLKGTYNSSTSTLTWASPVIVGGDNLQGIAYNGSLFMTVASDGAVLTSSDGLTWDYASLAGDLPALAGIVWSGSQFIIVGAGGLVLTTPDGSVFTKQVTNVTANLNAVVWTTNGGFAVGDAGTILSSSTDGLTWTVQNSGTGQNLKSIAWNNSNDRLSAVGVSGTILTSDPVTKVNPSVFFVNLDMTVDERVGVVQVPVFFTQIPSSDLSLSFTVTAPAKPNGATPGLDYTIIPSPLKITGSSITPAEVASGTLTRYIPVTIKGDALKEVPESLTITLTRFVDSTGKDLTNYILQPTACTLTITDTVAPTVNLDPATQHQMVALGSAVTMTADVTGSGPLLQWLKNGAVVPAATVANFSIPDVNTPTPATYNIPAVTLTSAGAYSVKVSNPAGSDMTNRKGVVAPAGTVEVSVVDQTNKLVLVKAGTSAVLTASAAGNGLIYQWFQGSPPSGTFLGSGGGPYVVAGNKLTVKGVVTGINEGDYYCTVVQSGAGHNTGLSANTGTFHVVAAMAPDIVAPTTVPRGAVGAPYQLQITRASSADASTPTSFTAKGLTAGLTINATTGLISGTPTVATPVAGVAITVTATNASGILTKQQFILNVDPIDPNALGTFVGLASRTGSAAIDSVTGLTYGTLGLGARFDVTTSANSSYSGKLTVGPTAYAFTGKLLTSSVDDPLPHHNPQGTVTIARGVGKSPLVLFFDIDPSTNLVTGTVKDARTTATLNGWRNIWTTASPVAVAFASVHNFIAEIQVAGGLPSDGSLPEGTTFGSFTPLAAGGLTVSGKTADGYTITTAGFYGPNGEVLLYQALYTLPGSICGKLTVNTADSTLQRVTGSLTWSHPKQTTGRTFAAGWPLTPLSVLVDGGRYYPATGTGIVMDLPDATSVPPSNAKLLFSAGGVSPTTNVPDLPLFQIKSPSAVVLPALNPAGTSLTVVNASGAYSGAFTLTDPDPTSPPPPATQKASVVRKVTFQGVIVPDFTTKRMIGGVLQDDPYDGVGYGYFLLPQLPDNTVSPATTAATSKILSGLSILESKSN